MDKGLERILRWQASLDVRVHVPDLREMTTSLEVRVKSWGDVGCWGESAESSLGWWGHGWHNPPKSLRASLRKTSPARTI